MNTAATLSTISQEEILEQKQLYIECLAAFNAAATRTARLDAELNAVIEAAKADHYAANAEAYGEYETAAIRYGQEEMKLRSGLEAYCTEAGVKTFDENLGVRVSTKYEYTDEDALAWAVFNAPVLIVRSIDRKAFESLPQTAQLPFVTKEAKTTAVIKGLK